MYRLTAALFVLFFDLEVLKNQGPLPADFYLREGVEWRIATPPNPPRTSLREFLPLERSEYLSLGYCDCNPEEKLLCNSYYILTWTWRGEGIVTPLTVVVYFIPNSVPYSTYFDVTVLIGLETINHAVFSFSAYEKQS